MAWEGGYLSLFVYTKISVIHLCSFITKMHQSRPYFPANLGLQPICTMIASSGSGKPLSQMAGMDPESLQKFLDKFDNFLVAPDVFLLPQTRLLSSSAHRKTVTKRSLQVNIWFSIYKSKVAHEHQDILAIHLLSLLCPTLREREE